MTLRRASFEATFLPGSVFQSSEMEDTGLKLDSTSLRMWDSNHNQTVYLDGEGKSNLLTGTFQTRASGIGCAFPRITSPLPSEGRKRSSVTDWNSPPMTRLTAHTTVSGRRSVVQSNESAR